jgi:hypothetical protein
MNIDLEVSVIVHQFLGRILELAQRSAQLPGDSTAVLWDTANKRRPRRTTEDLDRMSWRVYAFVQQHPGLRIEQINARLGTTTRELAFPIRQMLDRNLLRSEGLARATRYYIARTVALPNAMHSSEIRQPYAAEIPHTIAT